MKKNKNFCLPLSMSTEAVHRSKCRKETALSSDWILLFRMACSDLEDVYTNLPCLKVKHPIIMAKHHHVTNLLLQNIHEKIGHSDGNFMLSRLRQYSSENNYLSSCHLQKTSIMSSRTKNGRTVCRSADA